MAYTWPNLDPNEVADYSVDWSRFLGSNTISTVSWFVNGTAIASYETVDSLTLIQPTNTTTVATARFTAGIVGTKYKISCRITINTGETFERSIFLSIRENKRWLMII